MLRIKTNKSSFCKLVSDYEKLPIKTWFKQTPGHSEYWLAWVSEFDNLQCKAFITICQEQALLFITKKDGNTGMPVSTELYSPDLARLRSLGMIDETSTAIERRREERGAKYEEGTL